MRPARAAVVAAWAAGVVGADAPEGPHLAVVVEVGPEGARVTLAGPTAAAPAAHRRLHPPRVQRSESARDVHVFYDTTGPPRRPRLQWDALPEHALTVAAAHRAHAHEWDAEGERFRHGEEPLPVATLELVLPSWARSVVVSDDELGESHDLALPGSAQEMRALSAAALRRRSRRASGLGYWEPPRHQLINSTLELDTGTGKYFEAPLQRGGPVETQQNFVFLSSGYPDSAGGLHKFRTDLDTAVRVLQTGCHFTGRGGKRACAAAYNSENTNNIRRSAPYRRYWTAFNIWAVWEPSREVGATIPASMGASARLRNETILPTPAFVDDNLQCSYGTTMTRALFCNPTATLALADTAPCGALGKENVVVVVLVNAPLYGGAATYRLTQRLGFFSTAFYDLEDPDDIGQFGSLLVHELGHCFANLLDEYDTGTTESAHRDTPNCHWSPDPQQVSWAGWIRMLTAGFLFPAPGGGQRGLLQEDERFFKVSPEPIAVCGYTNYYRPSGECLMEALTKNKVVPRLCPVCREASLRMVFQTGLDLTYPKCPLPNERLYVTNSSGVYIFVNGAIATLKDDKDGGPVATAWHCAPRDAPRELTVRCSGSGARACLGIAFPSSGTRSRTFVPNSTTVNMLLPGGSAEGAGVNIGMSVAAVDGKAVSSSGEAEAALAGSGPHSVTFDTWRRWWAPPDRPSHEYDGPARVQIDGADGDPVWLQVEPPCQGCSSFVKVAAGDWAYCGGPPDGGEVLVRLTIEDMATWILPEHRILHREDPAMHRNMLQTHNWTVTLVGEGASTKMGLSKRSCVDTVDPESSRMPLSLQPAPVRQAAADGVLGPAELSYLMTCPPGEVCTVSYASRPLPASTEYNPDALGSVADLVFGLPGIVCFSVMVFFMIIWLCLARAVSFATVGNIYETPWDVRVSFFRKMIMSFGLVFMLVASSCIGYGMHMYHSVGAFFQLLMVAAFVLAIVIFVMAFSGVTAAFYRARTHLYINGVLLTLAFAAMIWCTHIVVYVGDNVDRSNCGTANSTRGGMAETTSCVDEDSEVPLCGIKGVGCGLKDLWVSLVADFPEKVCAFQDELRCSGYTQSCQRMPSSDYCPRGCDRTNTMFGDACKVKLQDDIASNCRRITPWMVVLTLMMAGAAFNNFVLGCILKKQETLQNEALELGMAQQKINYKQMSRAVAILQSLSPHQRRELKIRFHEADLDGNGTLNEREMGFFLRAALDRHLGDEAVHAAFCRGDRDGDGKITFEDFVTMFDPTAGVPGAKALPTIPDARTPSVAPPRSGRESPIAALCGGDPADGPWYTQGGSRVATVESGWLTWSDGSRVPLEYGPGGELRVERRHGGGVMVGRLGGGRLRWDGGEEWLPYRTQGGANTPPRRSPAQPRQPVVPDLAPGPGREPSNPDAAGGLTTSSVQHHYSHFSPASDGIDVAN
eukprot:TRINITY_DN7205_c0_g2_i1.p1 TRINITY_DN7205_c0_g2~~TRINITY_DN7205_c0_g2_i1.p1  ORF type:complete len:1455 (+),score=429.08 TRINITY_DN7205_c0_g2_i1:81-4367(+)